MKQPTREKILDSTYKLIYVNGYNGTSIDMILKESAIPKGSLYYHFKSKKEIALAVLKERIAPKMFEFYDMKRCDDEHGIDTIINAMIKVTRKDELIKFGCPLNRLNQEMSPVDKDFEEEIYLVYEKIKQTIITCLKRDSFAKNVDIDSLAEHVVAVVWGSLSLSPKRSSKQKYLNSINHLSNYLKSLKI